MLQNTDIKKIIKDSTIKILKEFKLPEAKLNEASKSKVFKAARKGSYPVTLVVIEKGKVVNQVQVNTPEAVPAHFNVLQEKYPKAQINVEDNTGKILFKEVKLTEASKRDPESIRKEYKDLKKQSISYLRQEWSRMNKVGDPKGTDKEGLISDILRGRHGNKYVAKAFNLKESVNEAKIDPQVQKVAELTGVSIDKVEKYVSSRALNVTKLVLLFKLYKSLTYNKLLFPSG